MLTDLHMGTMVVKNCLGEQLVYSWAKPSPAEEAITQYSGQQIETVCQGGSNLQTQQLSLDSIGAGCKIFHFFLSFILKQIRKHDPCTNICSLLEIHHRAKDSNRQKEKGEKKVHEMETKEKTKVTIFISDKTDFKIKAIKETKKVTA